jgi:hypothetical protein
VEGIDSTPEFAPQNYPILFDGMLCGQSITLFRTGRRCRATLRWGEKTAVVMRDDESQLRAAPASVMGFFSRDHVDVALHPGLVSEVPGVDGTVHEMTAIVPRALWPDELLRINADVWLLCDISKSGEDFYCGICARTGENVPDGYQRSFAGVPRAVVERLSRPRRGAEQSRWWHLWRR